MAEDINESDPEKTNGKNDSISFDELMELETKSISFDELMELETKESEVKSDQKIDDSIFEERELFTGKDYSKEAAIEAERKAAKYDIDTPPGEYYLNGNKIDREVLKSKLFDSDFIEELQEGKVEVEIEGDEKLSYLLNKQAESGSRFFDLAEAFEAGITPLKNFGNASINMFEDAVVEILGYKPGNTQLALRAYRDFQSKNNIEKTNKLIEKQREYEYDFIESIKNGNFSDAANIGFRTTAQSLPLMVISAIAARATGGRSLGAQATKQALTKQAVKGALVSSSVMSSILIPDEYAQSIYSDDEKMKKLSKGDKLTRAFIMGAAEGVGEGIMGPIGSKGFSIFKSGMKGLVKQTFNVGGKEAAKKMSRELAKKTALEIFKTYGLSSVAEGGSEAFTSLAQDLTDDFYGIKDLSLEDYMSNASEAGALGIFMGLVMGSPGTIASTGSTLLRRNKVKQGAVSEIRKSQELGLISKKKGDELILKVEELQNAIKQTDSNLSEEQQEKIASNIYKKKEIEKAIEGLDPNQSKVKEGKKLIEELNNEISEISEATESDLSIAEQQADLAKDVFEVKLKRSIDFLEKQGKKLGKKVYVVETDETGKTGNEKAQELYNDFVKENPGTKSMDVTNSDGFKIGDISVVNLDVARKSGALSVGSHETLHFVLDAYLDNMFENDLAGRKKLIKDFKNLLSKSQLDAINKRIQDNYSNLEGFDPETSVEWFNAFSDAIELGDISFDENIGNKILNFVQDILRKVGIKKEFSNARQAYNFMKDYSKSISKGELSKRSLNLAETKQKADKSDIVSFSKKASDNVQQIYQEQGVSGALDIINEFKPIVNKIVQRRSEAPGFDRQLLTDEIETGRGGILDLITKYKPDSGVPLAAFINKYLPVRAIEASRRVLGEVFESDISERVDIAEPTSKVEEVEITEKTKEPTNLRRALDIKEGGDLYNKVKEVVAKTFGTKIPAAKDPTFKKKLQDTYASELMSDIKDLMGKPSSDKYKTFLQEYGEQIYDLLPQDILNKSYQDFIVEKKKNLSPTEVDKAISDGLLPGDTPRTSGPSLFTKESFNQQKWVDYHLAPTKGRPASKQTQLAQTIAKELGKDATLEVLEDPKVFERFTAVEEIQGREVTKETKPKIAEKIKREPDVKFSKSVEKIINIRNLFELETKGIDKLLKSYGINETFNLKTEQGIKDFIVDLKNDLLPLMPKDFWFGNKAVLTPSYYIIGASQNNPQLKQKYKDLYNSVYVPAINEIRNDANQRYGKPIKGVKDYSIAAYSTIFKNSKTIENNLENGKIKNWNKKVELIHREMWNRFNKSISKNKKTASVIGNYLKFTGSATSHWHKLGAQFVGYSKDITGNRFEYEHAMPATSAYLYLIDAVLSESDFTITYDLTMNNYKLIALDKAMDKKLTSAKLQRKMPDDWSVIDNFWWQRYFNDIVSNQDGGIDPNSIIGLESKTFSEMFNVDASGNSTTIEVEKLKSKAKNVNVKNLSNNVVNFSKTDTNQDVIGYAKTIDEALSIARDIDAPVKKIRVFDFDDTLAKTKSIVFYTKADGTEGKLTAEEFAEKGADLVSEGAVMDFSDFNIVRDGKRGPLFDVAKKIEKARGTEDVFVLTARAPESQQAIHEFLKSEGLNIPLENITGLGNSTGAAKAKWIVDKASNGYNDFYFADDAYQNVKAVQDALDQIDVKSEVQQAKINFSKTLNEDFNKIIENTTGVAADKVYSKAKAQVRGANKGRFKFFIPYSAEDFLGLIYPTLSKGNLGNAQMAWYKKHILDPYTRAMESLSADRIQLMEDFKALKKALDVPKNLRKVNDSGFTNEQAVRVYLWNKMGYDVPGLSKTDLNELNTIVESDGLLKAFADQILNLTKGDGYSKPTDNWLVGTITTDLVELINTTKRSKYLEEWQQNIDEVYSQDNLNKLEAIYGSKYVEALKSTLSRMKSGKNRAATGNRLSNRILDYINGSVGAIMFFNTRSAVLQTISSINFVNWSFNNPLMAGKAFANQPQYWKDFMELMNSDFLVERRNGLKLNISESEIADAAATSKNKAKAALNYLLQKGFLPTQMADSFAIASGGATFYRNRINDLIKNKGLTEAEAKAQAMLEFRQIAETSQQSSDPSKISQQQSSDVGRLLLAFANTPMQYARMQKRAAQDLINGRGDAKSNISKIIYYGFVQNLIFNALQQAVNLLGFGDDEEKEEEEYKKKMKIANGMADSLLRGLGIGGQAVSVGKNFLLDIYERSERKRPEYVDAMWKLMQFSPPISSKISKLKQAAWHFDSKKRREKIFEKGFSLDNPAYEAGAKVISATTNLPLDRVYSKVNNIEGSLAEDLDVWQRLAMLGGWPEWQINPKDDKQEASKLEKGSVKIIEYKPFKPTTTSKKPKKKRKRVKITIN